MGRWSGLSGLINFHFEHGNGGQSSVNVTTRYHKLDDSIFVLCRNCGHSCKKESELNKKMEGGNKLGRNPKTFLTWSAASANNRLQKMSKTLANNITRLQLKMEKAIPFQQGVDGGEFCSKYCENGGFGDSVLDQDNNNCGHNATSCPDVVNMSKLSRGATSESSNDVKLLNKIMVKSARIVASHPSVSQSHSHVANPDKIIQINVESYNVYATEVDIKAKVSSDSDDDFNMSSGNLMIGDDDTHKNNKMLDMQSLDLFYDVDSGTGTAGSANTSISGSSLSSPNVNDLPVIDNIALWNRAVGKKSLSCNPNLNSSSPSVDSQKKRGHDSNKNDAHGNQGATIKDVVNNNKSTTTPAENTLLVQDFGNSTNSGVPTTDEKSFLIENNKSNTKRGLRNTGTNKKLEICNNKNSVASKTGNLGSTSLRLKSLKSQAYPPSSKLGVTIFEKEADLRDAPWFQAGIPRELALEILRSEPIGSFIVRESSTKPGCFALSLRVPKDYQPCGFANYLIIKSSRGYKIKGFTKEFTSLNSLITHHTVMKELLPCPLSLHQYQPPTKSLRVSRANSSDFMEPEKLFIGRYTDF